VLRRKLWSANRFVQMTVIDALGKSGKNAVVAGNWVHFFVMMRFKCAICRQGSSWTRA